MFIKKLKSLRIMWETFSIQGRQKSPAKPNFIFYAWYISSRGGEFECRGTVVVDILIIHALNNYKRRVLIVLIPLANSHFNNNLAQLAASQQQISAGSEIRLLTHSIQYSSSISFAIYVNLLEVRSFRNKSFNCLPAISFYAKSSNCARGVRKSWLDG